MQESGLSCVSKHIWKVSSVTQPKMVGEEHDLVPLTDGEDLNKSFQGHREAAQADSIWSIHVQ